MTRGGNGDGRDPASAGEGPEEAAGALFDAYLDALLEGSAEDPDAFLARHPGAGPELGDRLRALRGLAASSPVPRRSAGPARPAEPGLPHERLGEFRLLRRLGTGGMGMVFEAEQESLARVVALKVIRPDLVGSPEAVERFRREARALARLRHPGILGVVAAGEQDGVLYLATDLVPGRGLDAILEEAKRSGRPPSPARVLGWGATLARALEHAHARGLVHRDLKPANVRVTPDDRAKLLDFGIARELSGGATLTAAFVGSPMYAAPEQLRGDRVDARADVYGLAATLYHAVVGSAPFEGETVDGVIHRVLHEDPPEPRARNPRVPRDLEAVLLRGLEKDPARRYATAAAFAEDLEAILDLRPVRARPPGPLRRLRGWARRRPGAAAAAATGTVALVLLAAGLLARHRAEEGRVRREAAGEVAKAREVLEEWRRGREEAAGLERDLAYLRSQMESSWTDPAADALLDRKEDALERLRLRREAVFHEVLDRLRRAERLDGGVEGVDRVRAALYLERWREASDRRDAAAAYFYRDLAESHDSAGELRAALHPEGMLDLATDPPGAEVLLFRYRELSEVVPGGEPRMVPVPVAGEPPVPPGTWALRVVAGAGGLRAGDLVLSVAGHPVRGSVLVLEGDGEVRRLDRLAAVDGREVADPFEAREAERAGSPDGGSGGRVFRFDRNGESFEVRGESLADLGIVVGTAADAAGPGGTPARVLAGGRVVETTLPAGLLLRTTASPAIPTEGCRAGRTPLRGLRLEAGEYLALLRKEGFEDRRVPVLVRADAPVRESLRLLPAGTTPPGWVRVEGPREEEGPPFWILDREVTAGEYLEFLNDPATRTRVDAAPAPILFPRDSQTAATGGYLDRGPDGRFRLKGEWTPDWPVLGVSREDARAYAAWRAARDGLRGRRYALPTTGQWLAAAGDGNRRFVFGNRFRPKWIKSCFSRRRAIPEPVLRFPRDESALGVFDLAGGVMEWTASWYDEPRELRRAAGGSWARAEEEFFKIWGALGFAEGYAGGELGFRLVMVEEEAGR